MNSKFFLFILFYFILDHFVFTDEDYDMWAGEWKEGKTAHVCTVFGQKTIVHDRVWEKYGCIRCPYFAVFLRIRSFTTVYDRIRSP